MAASQSTRQLLLLLTTAFNTLKAQVQALGTGGTAVDAYTKAQADTLLAAKASKQDVAAIIGAAPAALDTLAELATQLRADEQGTAAILATQQQHTQDLAQLVRLPAYGQAQYGKVLGLSQAGSLVWVAAPAGTGGGTIAGPITENDLSPELLSLIESINLPFGFGFNVILDANGKLVNTEINRADIRDIVRDELASIGGLSVWAKPTLTAFDDTNVLAMSAPSPMEYWFSTSPTELIAIGVLEGGLYKGSLNVGNFDREEGYVQVRTKATSDKAASGWAKSPAFTAAATSTAPNLLPASENMNQRPPWDGNNSGIYGDTSPVKAPDGTMSMSLVTSFGSGSTFVSGPATLVTGESYVFSGVFNSLTVSRPGVTFLNFGTGLSKATLNIKTGAVTGVENCTVRLTDLSAQNADSAGCWYLEVVFTASNTSQRMGFSYDSTNAGEIDGSNFGTCWWQVNKGTKRSTYQPTYA